MRRSVDEVSIWRDMSSMCRFVESLTYQVCEFGTFEDCFWWKCFAGFTVEFGRIRIKICFIQRWHARQRTGIALLYNQMYWELWIDLVLRKSDINIPIISWWRDDNVGCSVWIHRVENEVSSVTAHGLEDGLIQKSQKLEMTLISSRIHTYIVVVSSLIDERWCR